MADYEKKEIACIEDVLNVIVKLDTDLDKLSSSENDVKKHSIKTWYYEKKAIHDIKKILHDIKKYDKYDDKELEKIDKEFDKLINS